MLRALSRWRRWFSFVALATFALVGAACGGGGRPSDSNHEELVVVWFSHAGRTDVFRNQVLDVTFNVPVKPDSVSDRTIKFTGGPNGQTPARGKLIVDGNVVHFDPREAQIDLNDRTVFEPNPFGFNALESFQLLVPSDPGGPRVQNMDGHGTNHEFFSTFRTIDEFVPELRQPLFVGDQANGFPGELVFSPAPDPATGLVDQSARVTLVFDEPMDPVTMAAGSTIIVRNEDLSAQFHRDELVPGIFVGDRSATRWTFESSAGFGRGPFDNLGISITITPGVKDLAGNPVGNPQTLVFKTAYEPNVPNFSSRTESFSSTAQRDFANTDAEWNGSVRGHLVGGAITKTTVEVMINNPLGTRTRLADILTADTVGSHTQALYLSEELGLAGTLAEVAWGPDSAALFAATHSRIVIKVGQTIGENLTNVYANNFDVAGPVRIYDGAYTIPQNADIRRAPPLGINPYDPVAQPAMFQSWAGFYPFPAFTSYFEYDGLNNLVLDFDTQPGTNFQILRVEDGWSLANAPPAPPVVSKRRLHGPSGATKGDPPAPTRTNPDPIVYDMSFTKARRVTVATSRFYNTNVANPDYGTPIINPPAQKGGATFTLEIEGQDGMPNPNNPFQTIPDPSTSTGWVTNMDLLDGLQFFRFRFTLFANLISETVVDIDDVTFPYTFQ